MSEHEDQSPVPEGASPISGTPPPVHSRWKKGQSGNPGGRRKGDSLTARLRRLLETEHNGKEIGDLLLERLVRDALQGKLGHIKEVLDRAEGKVTERHEIAGAGGLVINLVEVGPDRVPLRPRELDDDDQPRLP